MEVEVGKSSEIKEKITPFSVADKILKFKQLLDMGVLTQEEFDRKKQELLILE
ncbi:SHOCT domain-containing protein [Desulfosporosinus sp. HMP52]|uniref:SHOCT domain-containing protein n=1 Tax=Desulfosporosinus sp. HMP52 TaxID=1487923 RepID=UPI0009DD9BB6|nr:SHOCT domain-containing protein [Desulfosporosinus sp. HMP52]